MSGTTSFCTYGRWRRALRRAAVVTIGALWGLLASPFPTSLNGWGIAVALVILGLGLVLGYSTDWVLFRRSEQLDEFAIGLRDRSYRIAYRLFVLAIVLMLPALLISSFLGGTTISWGVPDPIGARGLAALVLLVLVMPSAIAGWLLPVAERGTAQSGSPLPWRRGYSRRWFGLLLPMVFLVWLAGIELLPISRASLATVPDPQLATSAGECGAYASVAQLGRGFGPSLGLTAQVCWNGREAWLANDPNGPGPAGVRFVDQGVAPAFCSSLSNRTDFGVLSQEACRVWIDRRGALHVEVTARAGSGLPGLGTRQLEIQLTVTRGGEVTQFT